MIPKLIHQIWISPANGTIPDILHEMSQTWQQNHPLHRYILWDKNMLNDFIKDNYPEAENLLYSFEYDIQRIDTYKYYILLHYGGLYVDLDTECIKPVDSLFENYECFLSQDSPDNDTIGNCFIAAVAQFDFIKLLINQLPSQLITSKDISDKLNKVLQTTGPIFLTQQYYNFEYKNSIRVLPYNFFSPITASESREMYRTGHISTGMDLRMNSAYAVHYFLSSWL